MRRPTATSTGGPAAHPWARRLTVGGAVVAVALAAAACGGGSAAPSGSSGSGSTTSPTAGSGGAGGLMVKMAQIPGTGSVLVDSKGYTLYRFTPDTSTSSACTGGCASTWPPLLLPAGVASPTAGSGVSGLGTISRGGGQMQVTYMGHPLYTYSGDSAPGQTNGKGISPQWFVMTVGSSSGGATTTTTPNGTTTSGGYGY